MKTDPTTGALTPFDFNSIYEEFPYLGKLSVHIDVLPFTPIDSSNVTPALWIQLVGIIAEHYARYDGFVILHGTDTMAYSASALSFMLENLTKPVVFTGSQIPIGVLRTDGRENLITAIEIAAAKDRTGRAMVPEVSICFQNRVLRANRTTKHSAEKLNAFRSDNYPALAEVGVNIHYHFPYIYKVSDESAPLVTFTDLEDRGGGDSGVSGAAGRYVGGDALLVGVTGCRVGNVWLGECPDGRMVRTGGRGCGGPRLDRDERDAMSGWGGGDGSV